jgi:transcriptional regulator of acetoin/glycerol metabolism
LIALDADDFVIGATRAARAALGITQASLQKPLPAADLLNTARKATEDLAGAERGVLQRALARADGNVTEAADALGVSRATLHRKLKRLNIHRAN